MPGSAPIVGLDFSGRSLRAIRAVRRRGRLTVQASTSVRRTRVNGLPNADDLRRLGAAMHRSGVGTSGIVASAPADLVGRTSMELPGSTDESTYGDSAAREMSRLEGRPGDDYVVACVAMPARRGGGKEVAISGCRHEAAAEFIKRCDDAGLDIVGLRPETHALARLLDGTNDPDDHQVLRACVLVDWKRVVVVINEGARPVFERVLPVDGLNACAEAVARGAQLDDREVVEHLLFQHGLAPSSDIGQRVRWWLDDPTSELLDEIDRTVRYACGRYRQRSVAEVLVIGEGARVPGLTDVIAERLGTLIGTGGGTLAQPDLALAQGLAALPSSDIEFVPPAHMNQRARQRRARRWMAWLSAYVIFLAVAAMGIGVAIPASDADRAAHLERVEADIAQLERRRQARRGWSRAGAGDVRRRQDRERASELEHSAGPHRRSHRRGGGHVARRRPSTHGPGLAKRNADWIRDLAGRADVVRHPARGDRPLLGHNDGRVTPGAVPLHHRRGISNRCDPGLVGGGRAGGEPVKRIIILPTDLWGIGAVVGLTLVAHLLVIRPTVNSRDASDALARSVVNRSQHRNALRADLEMLGREHDRLSEEVRSVRPLEPRSRLNERLGALGALAEAYDIEVLELQRVSETPAADICTVSLRMSGQGAFGDVVRCLHALRLEERHVAVEGIDVSGNPQAEGPVRVMLDLRWHAAPDDDTRSRMVLDPR